MWTDQWRFFKCQEMGVASLNSKNSRLNSQSCSHQCPSSNQFKDLEGRLNAWGGVCLMVGQQQMKRVMKGYEQPRPKNYLLLCSPGDCHNFRPNTHKSAQANIDHLIGRTSTVLPTNCQSFWCQHKMLELCKCVSSLSLSDSFHLHPSNSTGVSYTSIQNEK